MGREFFDVPLKEGTYQTCSTEDFAHYARLLSKERQDEANELYGAALKNMKQPIAVFRIKHRGNYHHKYRLCCICELDDLKKTMAKLVAKNLYGKKCRISVHAKDEGLAKQIKKRLKHDGKKAKITFFGRSTKNNVAILISA